MSESNVTPLPLTELTTDIVRLSVHLRSFAEYSGSHDYELPNIIVLDSCLDMVTEVGSNTEDVYTVRVDTFPDCRVDGWIEDSSVEAFYDQFEEEIRCLVHNFSELLEKREPVVFMAVVTVYAITGKVEVDGMAEGDLAASMPYLIFPSSEGVKTINVANMVAKNEKRFYEC